MAYLKPQSPLKHVESGDYFYPLTTEDQIIVDADTRLSDINFLSVDKNDIIEGEPALVNADTLGGVLASNYATNDSVNAKVRKAAPRNLLDNSDFTNPVNQRGLTTYEAPSGAPNNIDRWYGNRATITVDGDGITLLRNTTESTSATYIGQKLEDASRLIGKKITIAFSTGKGLFVGSGTFTGEAVHFYDSGGWKLSFTTATNAFVIQTTSEESIKLYWAALYEGEYTAETLPEYQPKGYGAELAECQRYAIPIGGTFRYRACQVAASIIDFAIPLPSTLRAVPSFDVNKFTVYGFADGVLTAQTDFSFVVERVCVNGFVIRATKTNHGLKDAILNASPGTILSAEL